MKKPEVKKEVKQKIKPNQNPPAKKQEEKPKQPEATQQTKFELSNQILKIDEMINLKTKEKLKLGDDLDRLKNEVKNLEKLKEEELKQKKYQIEDEIRALESKKSTLDNEIEAEIEIKSEAVKEKEAHIRYLEQKRESLEAGIKTLQEQFTGEQKTAHQKLQDLLSQNQHYNILSGREFTDNNNYNTQIFINYQLKNQYNPENFDKLKEK